jgi:hypothetical protein
MLGQEYALELEATLGDVVREADRGSAGESSRILIEPLGSEEITHFLPCFFVPDRGTHINR